MLNTSYHFSHPFPRLLFGCLLLLVVIHLFTCSPWPSWHVRPVGSTTSPPNRFRTRKTSWENRWKARLGGIDVGKSKSAAKVWVWKVPLGKQHFWVVKWGRLLKMVVDTRLALMGKLLLKMDHFGVWNGGYHPPFKETPRISLSFHPYLRKWSNLTVAYFSDGWFNHQRSSWLLKWHIKGPPHYLKVIDTTKEKLELERLSKFFPKQTFLDDCSQMLHETGIFTYIWLEFMVFM